MNASSRTLLVALLSLGVVVGIVVGILVHSLPPREAERWLSLEIDRPPVKETEARETPAPDEPDESGLFTNVYQVHPGMFTMFPNSGPVDPFAAVPEERLEPHLSKLRSAQEVLEDYGITFSKAASASFDPATSRLRVRQTQDQMELVEAVILSVIGQDPEDAIRAIRVRLEIYEVSAAVARQIEQSATEHYEHTPERDAVLLEIRKGRASLVQSANILARSGHRALFEDASTVRFLQPSPEGNLELIVRKTGTLLQVDPVIGGDWHTIDINLSLEFHLAAPTWESRTAPMPGGAEERISVPRFHVREISTTETMLDGEVCLIGSWRPDLESSKAKDELRHLVFLSVNLNSPQVDPS